jgi:hypothetical protein
MSASPALAPTTIEATIIRKLWTHIIPFVFVLFVINFVDRINIGFAALTMNRELAITTQIADPFEIALSRKLCRRSLNPVGISNTRSSPVITSNFRVLSYTAVQRWHPRRCFSILWRISGVDSPSR